MIITVKDWIHTHLAGSVLGPLTSHGKVSVFMGDVVCGLGVVSRLASIGLKDEGDMSPLLMG